MRFRLENDFNYNSYVTIKGKLNNVIEMRKKIILKFLKNSFFQKNNNNRQYLSMLTLITVVLVGLRGAGEFSNSFIEADNHVLYFMSQTMLFLIVLFAARYIPK